VRWLVVCSLLLATLVLPQPVTAALMDDDEDVTLHLSCRSDNDCVLTPTPIGEESVGGQTTATLFQPETVVFEFNADPGQNHVALLPERLTAFELDVRQQTESGGLLRPEVDVRIVLGPSVNEWNFPADILPSGASYEPHTLDDASLNLDNGRVVWVDEPIRIILTITLDRPGSWALNMRGASFLTIEVPWSVDADAQNVDEPSSSTEPVDTDFEDVHRGALVGADRDCWRFNVEEHEVLRLMITWYEVPIELEQPHGVPEFVNDVGRRAPSPEVIAESDGLSTQITYRWRALDPGVYSLCMTGSSDRFQAYAWSGVFGYESLGPTDPTGFEGQSFYPAGAGRVDAVSDAVDLERQGYTGLFIALVLTTVLLAMSMRPTTSMRWRYGGLVPGVLLLLVGGILHPLVAIGNEVQGSEEVDFDDLVEMRLQQLWDVSAPGVPEQTLVTHTGATWGLLDGERLNLRLEVERAVPTEDGRWQLIVPELEQFRMDQAIFGQVGRAASWTSDGMLEDQTVRFVLLAGRSLLLDFMMLEAMLVVDERPASSVVHINTDMVATQAAGSPTAPAWSTRPGTVSDAEWVTLQQSLFPERISISLCDCDLDLMDVQLLESDGFEVGDVPGGWGIASAQGLTPYAGLMTWLGVGVAFLAVGVERRRWMNAKAMAAGFGADPEHGWL